MVNFEGKWAIFDDSQTITWWSNGLTQTPKWPIKKLNGPSSGLSYGGRSENLSTFSFCLFRVKISRLKMNPEWSFFDELNFISRLLVLIWCQIFTINVNFSCLITGFYTVSFHFWFTHTYHRLWLGKILNREDWVGPQCVWTPTKVSANKSNSF